MGIYNIDTISFFVGIGVFINLCPGSLKVRASLQIQVQHDDKIKEKEEDEVTDPERKKGKDDMIKSEMKL